MWGQPTEISKTWWFTEFRFQQGDIGIQVEIRRISVVFIRFFLFLCIHRQPTWWNFPGSTHIHKTTIRIVSAFWIVFTVSMGFCSTILLWNCLRSIELFSCSTGHFSLFGTQCPFVESYPKDPSSPFPCMRIWENVLQPGIVYVIPFKLQICSNQMKSKPNGLQEISHSLRVSMFFRAEWKRACDAYSAATRVFPEHKDLKHWSSSGSGGNRREMPPVWKAPNAPGIPWVSRKTRRIGPLSAWSFVDLSSFRTTQRSRKRVQRKRNDWEWCA